MSFALFLALFVAAVVAVAFAIIDRMPFPPMAIWAVKMIVMLVAGLTILLGLHAQA